MGVRDIICSTYSSELNLEASLHWQEGDLLVLILWIKLWSTIV